MSREISVQNLLFDVDQLPIEAVVGTGEGMRRIGIPGKKALVNTMTGRVLGVVSRDYRVVTNMEAVNMARQVCEHAFPGISVMEWEAKRGAAPGTLSYAFIDLMHRTHVLNYWDDEIKQNDPFTPFLRVTNSFNGARALRFDIGFMRKHCSNGVIFEEEVATIKASHNTEALEKLKIEIKSRSLPKMWEDFSRFLTSVRGVAMDGDQSVLALKTVLHLSPASEDHKPTRRQGLQELSRDLSLRLEGYRKELGFNAYAVFNTLTDIAARPPDNPYFQKDRDTIEKRSGRWLKELARQNQQSNFNLDEWLLAWEVGITSRQIPGRN